ncbi:MAG TPA: family 16 glycosylhydrolase, partial [Bryobacteraceae bacterium]|nr:family 16 glycosylhydrolase [Bryobacteraceae bacterium]
MISANSYSAALGFSLLLFGAGSVAAQPVAPVQGYTLAWSDEFDQSALDTARWTYRTDSKHWSTQTPANIHLEGGSLVIDLRKQAAGGKQYTGGGVISTRAFGYGYYESRFRIRAGKGWHSSFWMMKHNGSGGTDPAGADLELDVIENDSIDLNSYGVNTHRWKGEHLSVGHKNIATSSLADFHVFGCEYTPSEVRYFLDDRLVQTADVSAFPRGDVHIWLTSIASQLGKTDAVDEARLPGRVEYDYVRFYVKTAADRAAAPSSRMSLNGEWFFATDSQHQGESQRWFESVPELRWDRVTVPHCWPVDPRFPYVGPAWYRRHFQTPPAWAGTLVRLHFEAVFYKCRMWVNGKLAGNHEGGYTPFDLDVTGLLKPSGEDNLVVVEVDNSWDTTTLPGARPGTTPEKALYPWWDFGGIVRDVTLLSTPPVYLARQSVQAVPDLKAGTARVKATVWVANTTPQAVEREVSIAALREGRPGVLAGSALSR